ncbi:unnamed protein product [Rotaria sp. Silwood1]|nr:unnamed protein product [Rotaria sp. Silwood1]
MDVFLHDLNQAYTAGELSTSDDTILRYIDYATIEKQMSMTAASMYWRDTLRGYSINHSLPLPFDRYRLSDERRTGLGISVSPNNSFQEDKIKKRNRWKYNSTHMIP